jgi:hypothetical protein
MYLSCKSCVFSLKGTSKTLYSETSLQRTRTGPKKMSAIEECPLKREIITLVHYVTDLKNRP